MSSATGRFFSLFLSPFPLLSSRPRNPFLCVANRRSRLFFSLSPSSSFRSSFSAPNYLVLLSSPSLNPIKCSQQFHFNAQPQNLRHEPLAGPISPSSSPSFFSSSNGGRALLPWPEWSKFFDSLVSSGYFSGKQVGLAWDELVDSGGLPDDFVRAADACLAFAQEHHGLLGSLSRKDVGVLVDNVLPFIFKNGADSSMKMKSFLGGDTDHSDKPSTLDLMRYLLSYMSTILVPLEGNRINNMEIVESSVRKLFIEFVEINGRHLRSLFSESLSSDRPTPGSFGQNIEMKKGDWICPRCSFMNFARNMKCLECEEPRPKRLLTGGEWECPQCDFFNYGRNKVCLRCDCKKPGLSNPVEGLGYSDYSNSRHSDKRLSRDEEKAQSWFTKLSHLENASDANSGATDENIPGIMPLHKGVHELGIDAQNQTKLGTDRFSRSNLLHKDSGKQNLNAKISQLLDEILQQSADGSGSGRSSMGDEVGQNVGIGSQSQTADCSSMHGNTKEAFYDKMGDRERKQTGKSDRWFKWVGELHDVKDLPSAISDKDFLEIMPMRKGENQFVVSKRKDRSLTTPLYKRRMAMEQSGSSNYVPFVPFPPGYFAKDIKPVEGPSSSSSEASTIGDSSMHTNPENLQNNPNLDTDYGKSGSTDWNQAQPSANQQTSTMAWNSRGVGDVTQYRTGNSMPLVQNNVNHSQNSLSAQGNYPRYTKDSSSRTGSSNEADSRGSISQSTESQSIDGPLWRRSSLEGSAVKEPDPLDMSEEAKTERFFKRVAQIKDIKELSEIPDEDFPSIMPMRKGINRFVVSKRKTPLERRLSQSQYRRNLPVVNSDSTKQENEQSEN